MRVPRDLEDPSFTLKPFWADGRSSGRRTDQERVQREPKYSVPRFPQEIEERRQVRKLRDPLPDVDRKTHRLRDSWERASWTTRLVGLVYKTGPLRPVTESLLMVLIGMAEERVGGEGLRLYPKFQESRSLWESVVNQVRNVACLLLYLRVSPFR